MTRNKTLAYIKSLGIESTDWNECITAIDTVLALKQFEKCNNCDYNNHCIVQQSILEINPKELFVDFGCNQFIPCK